MPRRTKAQALETRGRILDTAEQVFEAHGVAGTSLQEIARQAGVTRGAIYWHFENKAELFNAMMDRATLPLEDSRRVCGFASADLTLAQMREGFVELLRRAATDAQMRRVFTIATHKVEYVGEMLAVRDRHIASRGACLRDAERTFRQARRRGELSTRLPARAAAIGLYALIDGLLQNWILQPEGFDLVRVGRQVIDVYLGNLGRPQDPVPG